MNVRFIYSLAGNLDSLLQKEILSHDLVDPIKRKGKIIQLPPLRERKEDIIDIAKNFLEALNRDRNSTSTFIDKKAQKFLTGYYWPGNIDELKQVITDIFKQNPEINTILAEHIPEHIKNPKKIERKYSFKLKNKERFTGTFHSDFFCVEKKDKAKIKIDINNLIEIIRVENEQFMPPRFEHFIFELKDGTQAAGKFLDQMIKVETASKAFNQIKVQDLYSVVLS